ncbi:hypothetical protein [Halobacillus litoralis]|uniref:hypothetical protein n=1 Tax=Halobacillus litoralis TaxID=45668 RepID=UPI00136C3284|nr:hypothetical protein [Halobacillus litoralis]MYL38534.1 hypothetical protein [Halobacillus litoralis]
MPLLVSRSAFGVDACGTSTRRRSTWSSDLLDQVQLKPCPWQASTDERFVKSTDAA